MLVPVGVGGTADRGVAGGFMDESAPSLASVSPPDVDALMPSSICNVWGVGNKTHVNVRSFCGDGLLFCPSEGADGAGMLSLSCASPSLAFASVFVAPARLVFGQDPYGEGVI